MPILHIHGTRDGLVPFHGSLNGGGPFKFRSVEESVGCWFKVNGCTETAVATELPATQDRLKVIRKDYGNGKAKAPVIVYVIEGGGHTWPGMDGHAAFLGQTTHNINANDVIWEFFRQFSLK